MQHADEHLERGDALLRSGNYAEAIESLQIALEQFSTLNDLESFGYVNQLLGFASTKYQKWEAAATHFEKAGKIAKQLGDAFAPYELEARFSVCNAFFRLAINTPPGRDRYAAYEKILPAAERLVDRSTELDEAQYHIKGILALGTAYRGLGQLEPAVFHQRAAFRLAEQQDTLRDKANCLQELGLTRLAQQRFESAARYFFKVIALLNENEQAILLLARGHHGLAHALLGKNSVDEALHHAKIAVELAQKQSDPLWQARSLGTLALSLRLAGEFETAVSHHQKAISFFEKVDSDEARLDLTAEWGNIASSYRLMGQYQLALQSIAHAITLADKMNSEIEAGKWLSTLGTIYEEIGDLAQAARHHEKALIRFPAEATTEIGLVRNHLGVVTYHQAMRENDIELLQHAQELFEQICKDQHHSTDDEILIAGSTGNLGLVYLHLHNIETAIYCFEDAKEVFEQHGRLLEVDRQYENLGMAYAKNEDAQGALAAYQQGLQLAIQIGDTDGQRMIHTRIGQLYQTAMSDFAQARIHYQDAVALAESSRSTLAFTAHRISLQSRLLDTYEHLIYLNWLDGDIVAAFNWSERARARVFTEQVGLTLANKPTGLSDSLFQQEQAQIQEIRQLEQQLQVEPESTAQILLAAKKRETLNDLQSVWQEMAEDDDPEMQRYVAMRQGTPATAEMVQKWLDKDENGEMAVLVFYTLPHAICCWVFRHKQPQKAIQLDIDKELLGCFVDMFESELVFPSGAGTEFWSKRLSAEMAKLAPYLDVARHLYLVSHGSLHKIPLHALRVTGEILGEKWPITYMPNAGLLIRPFNLTLSAQKTGTTAFGFSDEPSEQKIFNAATKQVGAFFGSNAFVGKQANKSIFKDEAENAGFIFLLCHGEFNQQNALDSGLRLSGGKLTAREIMALDLSGAIVILTACQGGTSKINPGDEMAGLSYAFLLAGATAVLAPHWNVQQKSAIAFVQTFYTEWQSNTLSLAEAYQKAIKHVRQIPPDNPHYSYQHPYFWAPFTLMGYSDRYNNRIRGAE